MIPGLGRSPGEGKGYPLQYSGLENSMDCSPPGFSVNGDSPGKNTRVGCHALLQGIFLTQGSNPGLPHCRRILYYLGHQGSQIRPAKHPVNPQNHENKLFFKPLIFELFVTKTSRNDRNIFNHCHLP